MSESTQTSAYSRRREITEAKRGPLPGEGGAPEKEIDVALAVKLASINCTDVEISHMLNISHDTLARRKQADPEFLAAFEHSRANGKASLRRKQFERAMAGSDTMLVWLGKQLLGQRDRFEHAGDPDNPLTVRYVVEVPPAIEGKDDWRRRYAPPMIDAEPVKD
jgi:hypothetical protein